MPIPTTTWQCQYCSAVFKEESSASKCEAAHFELIPELSEVLKILAQQGAKMEFTWIKGISTPNTIIFSCGEKRYTYTFTGLPR